MTACQDVGRWVTENILVPVEQFFEQAREACSEARRWVEREVRRPIESWRTQEEQRCREQPCDWWCLCCNKWFCWIVTVLVKVIEWVIEVVGEWVVETVCHIVVEVVRIVVTTVIRVLKWVVDFVVCLFTDPLSALKSITDLWFTITELVEDVVDLVIDVLDAVNDLLEITEDFIVDLGQSFGPLGTFLAAIFKWVSTVVQGVITVVRDILEVAEDLVLGILRLDPCRLAEAGVNLLGVVGGAVSTAGQAIGGGYLGGARDIIEREFVEDIMRRAIDAAFDDAGTRAAIRNRLQLGTARFGLPVFPDLRRMFISSREVAVDLRALHREGVLNLFQAAGYTSGCENDALNRPRTEVLYAGTNVRVTWRDLDAYLNGSREEVAEFHVFAITTRIFMRYYKLAQRKARTLGLRFESVNIGTYRVTQRDEIPVNDSDQEYLFQRIGRTATAERLCRPPAIALFGYQTASLNGLTTWFRPPRDIQASGVSFKDRQPSYLFRWVLIHELGHYFGIDHTGHNGAHHIMFTNAAGSGLDPVTGETVAELVFFTGEPRFNIQDAQDVWTWLTTNARSCILGEDI